VAEEFDEKQGLPQDERRSTERARLLVDVFFNGTGGLYMNTQTELPEGSVLMIRIPFSDGQQVVVNAEVVYSNPGHGVGVRFQGLTEKDRALMERELPSA